MHVGPYGEAPKDLGKSRNREDNAYPKAFISDLLFIVLFGGKEWVRQARHLSTFRVDSLNNFGRFCATEVIPSCEVIPSTWP